MRIVCTRFFFPVFERARAAVWTLFQVSKICGIKFIASEITRAGFHFFNGGTICAAAFCTVSTAPFISSEEVVSKTVCAVNVVIKNRTV